MALCSTRSDEMAPQWFTLGQAETTHELPSVPFDKMWPDVVLWFPLLLSRRNFVGRVDFAKDDTMQKWTITAEKQ